MHHSTGGAQIAGHIGWYNEVGTGAPQHYTRGLGHAHYLALQIPSTPSHWREQTKTNAHNVPSVDGLTLAPHERYLRFSATEPNSNPESAFRCVTHTAVCCRAGFLSANQMSPKRRGLTPAIWQRKVARPLSHNNAELDEQNLSEPIR